QSFHGILVRRGDAGSEISSNTIYNLSETGTNGKLIGLTQTGGEYTIQNNMIAIDGNGTMETYGLVIDSESGTTLSSVVRNNTLLLEGQGANGSSVTYLHSTNNTDNLELVNNIIFNNHQNADGYVYTLSNTDTGTRMSSNYNFLYNTATNRGIRIGGVDQTTSQWKNIQDNYSWILANNETNEHIIAPGTIFQDPTMGDLRINSSAGTAAMYVYGKGLSLSGFSTDHQGSARTTNTGIPITIGADEIPYPSGQSLSARMVGTIADGNTSNFVIANQAVASITWNANGGMLPSDFSLQHVTGQGVSEEFALSGRPPTELRSFMRMTPTGGSGNWIATVRYYYHPNVAGGVDPMDGMVLTRARNNTGMNVFDHVHNGITTGTEIDGRAFIQVSGVQGSEFDLPFLYSVSSNPVVTPVTLVAFIATPNEYQVLVQWETASEINNDYFEIERSYQGAQEFEVISKIQGNGTTNSPRSYSWTDSPSMLQSEIHYRLKQVDYDGTYEYFEPVRVEMENAIDQKVVAYPNPANQRVNLRWSVSKDRRLQLFNVSGALVKSFAERVIQQTTLNLKDLPRGVYYLNVLEEGNLKERVRIVK
ncbi:MAG: T9SS type A sorting domain-containing protein, partial [Bacteroidota bacterium]